MLPFLAAMDVASGVFALPRSSTMSGTAEHGGVTGRIEWIKSVIIRMAWKMLYFLKVQPSIRVARSIVLLEVA